MSRDSDTLNLIQASFPGRDQLIEQALSDNGSFRDLCEDYRKCFAAVHRWKRPTAAEADSWHQEYTELLEALGREIEIWLEAMDPGSSRPQGGSR